MELDISKLRSQIASLEKRLATCANCEEEPIVADEVLTEDETITSGLDDLDDLNDDDDLEGLDELDELDDLDDDDDLDGLDDDDLDDDDILLASEEKDGVEDEITQDYLDEMEEETDTDDVSTEDSVLDASPTKMASSRIDRLRSASRRLDRLADYVEKHGEKRMAEKLDRIANAVDAQIKKEVQ